MTVTYRRFRPSELPALIDLRAAALDTSPAELELVFTDFGQELDPSQRTLVAVDTNGTLLATVGYWLRERRGLDGASERVGHLYGVATRHDARRQGHASHLLEHAIAAMQAEGCAWSVLFTREEARPLYARAGWQPFSHQRPYGTLAATRPPLPEGYLASLFDPRDEGEGREQLAAVYADYNRTRPLTVVRSLAYWRSYAAWMLNDWLTHHRAVVIAVRRSGDAALRGYALVHYYDQAPTESDENWFIVTELGALPADPEALPALLAAIGNEATRRGVAKGAFEMPVEPETMRLLQQHLVAVGHELQRGSLMARPIAPSWTESDLAALFAASGAIAWHLDSY
jgi:GNAT superfamily N-acetyltransferase